MTNCINCGAILVSSKCEYCGTEYNTEHGFTINMIIGGKAVKFYVEKQEMITSNGDIYRDSNGKLHNNCNTKMRLTLMEM